ncbi:hypothetical protein ACFPN2_26350 [Steroidobacter flavus]|uniref:Uncharacterized protein n=1 Tax=Steroidobacter flavus TaxID=1842136 RepID=A0ABV8T0E4_9GAMM
MQDLGASAGGYTATDGTTNLSLAQLMAQGAHLEDEADPQVHPTETRRFCNHFFDPQFASFTGRGLDDFGGRGLPSPDWALEDRFTVTTVVDGGLCNSAGSSPSQRPQDFSYRDALDAMYKALTYSDAGVRSQQFGRTFQILGQVVHHLQDMAQPQHTRNEGHAWPTWLNWYEAYTTSHVTAQQIHDWVVANPYAPPSLPTARNYWTSTIHPSFIGMAEFTSQNYASPNHMFAVYPNPQGQLVIDSNPAFPYPSGQNPDGSRKHIEVINYPQRLSDSSTRNMPVRTILGDVFDGHTGQTYKDRKLAAWSLLAAPYLNQGMGLMALTTPPLVVDDYYPILLPRAVAFSAGLVNHFFRGRVDLQRNSAGSGWLIKNVSSADQGMDGTFTIYSETAAGVRQPIPGAVFVRNLAAGQSSIVTFTEPATTTSRLVVVFTGQIGAEVPADSGFQSIAGKVVTYSPPLVPCGQPLSAGGSSEGFNQVMEMGSEAGPVQIEFEAYSIPDKFEVRAESSAAPVLVTTTNQVSGWHTWTYQFNPTSLGTSKFRIRVTGNSDPGTLWTATVSCPNKTLTNSDRIQDRIAITFGVGATVGAGCDAGYINVMLNGKQATRLNFSPGVGDSGTVTVTAGTHQRVELLPTITSQGTPGFTCQGNGTVFWTDRAGQHYVNGSPTWISIQ